MGILGEIAKELLPNTTNIVEDISKQISKRGNSSEKKDKKDD